MVVWFPSFRLRDAGDGALYSTKGVPGLSSSSSSALAQLGPGCGDVGRDRWTGESVASFTLGCHAASLLPSDRAFLFLSIEADHSQSGMSPEGAGDSGSPLSSSLSASASSSSCTWPLIRARGGPGRLSES